ncbi:MAG: hypothetical protein M3O23_11780 [Actinomycetota bacterium]|nr:hypothetical protein [Actinomycetota bacterium]
METPVNHDDNAEGPTGEDRPTRRTVLLVGAGAPASAALAACAGTVTPAHDPALLPR